MESTVLQCTLGSLVSSHLLTDFQTVNSDLYLIPILSKIYFHYLYKEGDGLFFPKTCEIHTEERAWVEESIPGWGSISQRKRRYAAAVPKCCSEVLRGAGSSHSSQATKNFLSSMKWARHSRRGKWREKRSLLVLLAGNNWKTSLLFLRLTTLVGK